MNANWTKKGLIVIGILLLVITNFQSVTSNEPLWEWAEQSNGSPWVYDICVDSEGNTYITGDIIRNAQFGSLMLNSNGGNIFVAKLNTNGEWQWAVNTQGGGCGARGICVDQNNNIYITGYSRGKAIFGSTTLTGDYSNVFVAKLNTIGEWQWAVQATGGYDNWGLDICVDLNNNVSITGSFAGTKEFGSITITSNTNYDAFIAKINSDGSWQWAFNYGNDWADYGLGICADSNNNIYATGYIQYIDSGMGGQNVFVMKYTAGGKKEWVVNGGGIRDDSGTRICVDDNNIYVTGTFQDTAKFGTTILTAGGSNDIFVAKLNTGGLWQWATTAGATGFDQVNGICVGANNNIYVTGYFKDTIMFGTTKLTSNGLNDAYIAKLNSNGVWQWAVNVGGIGDDKGFGIFSDVSNNIYVTGEFKNNVVFGSSNLTSDSDNVYVAKFLTDEEKQADDTYSEDNRNQTNSNDQNRNIILTGFWNPTGQMIAQFSTDPSLNPDGWKGANWENLGYNIYSYFPTPETYTGEFQIDYQATLEDFQRITNEKKPVAIISFGAGDKGHSWTIEYNARNLGIGKWEDDKKAPTQPTPCPPEGNQNVGYERHSTLPIQAIENAVNAQTSIEAWVDWNGNPGAYLCEYMAYLGMQYQALHNTSNDPYRCLAAGFIHVKPDLKLEDAMTATNVTIREVVKALQNTPLDRTTNKQPGFELVFALCAIGIVMFLRRKKQSV